MPSQYVLSESLRKKLKEPLGDLILDAKVSRELLLSMIYSRPYALVSVGDRTTETLHKLDIVINLEIVDKIEKRAERELVPWLGSKERLVKTTNPAGTITSDSLSKLKKCLDLITLDRDNPVRLEVEGEEDLLALPVIAFFPEGTFVLYGQPNEGLVFVDSKKSREKCKRYLSEMGIKSIA